MSVRLIGGPCDGTRQLARESAAEGGPPSTVLIDDDGVRHVYDLAARASRERDSATTHEYRYRGTFARVNEPTRA
jgi:hypothetical protein